MGLPDRLSRRKDAVYHHLSLIHGTDGRVLRATKPMNSSNLFFLGLLMLIANLSLAAIFPPARAGRAEADRLLLLWKLLLLAAIQIGAWAIVLDQGGAAPSLANAFTRAAACFALIGGSGGGLAAPWGEVAPFIALNGLLYVLVALLPLVRGNAASVESDFEADVLPPALPEKTQSSGAVAPSVAPSAAPAPTLPSQTTQARQAEAAPSPSRPPQPSVPPAGVVGAAQAPGGSGTGDGNGAVSAGRPTEPEFQRGGFRATIPKATPINVQLSPEEELAEQMKPVGPTPPPIRFQWKN